MGLIDENHQRSATVRAHDAVKVSRIDRRQFDFLVRNQTSFAREVMKTMADRLRYMNRSATTPLAPSGE